MGALYDEARCDKDYLDVTIQKARYFGSVAKIFLAYYSQPWTLTLTALIRFAHVQYAPLPETALQLNPL